MDKRIQIAAIIGAVAFSVMVLSSPSDPIPLPSPDDMSDDGIASHSSVSILATDLEKPRAIAIYDDIIFIAEKKGTIRVVQNGTISDRPLAVFRVADHIFDGGLLGIAAHPDYDENRYLYAFLTYEADAVNGTGSPGESAISTITNKVVRITVSDENRLQDTLDVMDGIPASKFTNGGFVKFGPDKKLYVGTGTTSGESHLPQDLQSLAGKILRINDDGSIPADNPFGPDSPVYSMGHRNPQGIAWDDDNTMYAVDIGPEKNDEINVIIPGANYGWPDRECSGDVTGAGAALLCYDPSIEPGGIAYYDHSKLNIEHPFVMTSLRASNLYQIDFEEGLPSQKPILSGAGRIRDVAVDPADGSIYVITSNTDGKGFPNPDDDRLIHIQR